MADVKVYTTAACPFCVAAKRFLEEKGIPFDEINLSGKEDELMELKKKTGWRTVPQIFIRGKMIGGYTELKELDGKNELASLLS